LILVDTDVLIWVTRKDPQACAFLDSFDEGVAISDVTYMELIQGAKNKREAQAIDKTLKNMEVLRLPITTRISEHAVSLVRRYFHSHSMQLADALIAATALEQGLIFATGNVKHFEVVEGLQLRPFVHQPGIPPTGMTE
jgi:predicted nucleic acid-binding protein